MICAAEIDMMYECRITIDKFVLLFKLDEQMELSLRMSFINIAMAHSYYDEAISQTKAIGLIVPHRKDIWCYFNYMIILSRKHTNPVVLKYFSRMQQKYPNETIITIVLGNLFLTTCQFNKALQQYLSVYQSQKDSSLLNLQIALSFLGNVSNRNTVDKSNCFINALSFMEKYLKLCSYKKEALFNIARMYHQLEITHIAVHYYEQALSIIPNDANEALLDREIAYNMSLIYVKAENIELAIRIRQRYLMF
ncbi:General transcription factor 3C polypeptide 3 [Entamoeba marina]